MTLRSSNRPRAARGLAGLVTTAALLGHLATARAARAGGPAVAFEGRPDGLAIRVDGRPFARYVTGSERITRPYFESLHAPDGTRVTRPDPPVEGVDLVDHATFHPGLWLAFGDLGGADSWRNRDRIRHGGWVEAPRGGPGRGSFAVRNLHERGGSVIAEEVCRVAVLPRPQGTLLLWDSEFRPSGGALSFGDQEEMGLGVRVATPLAVVRGGRIVDAAGRVDEAQVWGRQADWCAYDGEVEGRRVGVALMPHPGNVRPSWFHARDYGLLVANPFGRNAFTGGEPGRVVVREGEALRLRFGVLVFDGRPDLGAAFREYVELAGSREGR